MTKYGFILLFLIILIDIFEIFLEIINLKHATKKAKLPNIPDFLTKQDINQTLNYQRDKLKVEIFETFINIFFFLFIFLSGIIQQFAQFIINLTPNEFLRAIIFFGSLQLASGLLRLPFEYYEQFVVEEKYGFNKMTLSLFIKDLIISTVIGSVIFAIIIFVLLKFIQIFQNSWWILASIFIFIFMIFLNYLYPILIAPLFNKFEPITEDEILNQIKELSDKTGFDLNKVFKMDASKRSTHTNAYFTGFGKKKRVVLFDTLLEKLNPKEIKSVLAHELGHYKKQHIFKNLLISFILTVFSFYLTYLVIDKTFIYTWFGFPKAVFIGLFLISILFAPFKTVISPLILFLSRKFEFEADSYAIEITKDKKSLISSLIKLYKDNLSNPFPHPIYVFFNYSHPPLLIRIKRIEENGI